MISLWVATAYLIKNKKPPFISLITALPAAFMTAVSFTYILMDEEGFRLSETISYSIGLTAAALSLVNYFLMVRKLHGVDVKEA